MAHTGHTPDGMGADRHRERQEMKRASHDPQVRVPADELEEGDEVLVHVNDRARGHLGVSTFKATVEYHIGPDIAFRPKEQLQEQHETHTWYSDIGYIHGHHDGLGRYSDIGKVRKVTRLP